MRIIIDIGHPAHINFFKNSIEKLSTSNEVYITYLKRGVLPKIIEKEFSNYKTFQIGKHEGTKFSIIFHANLFRFIQLFFFILKHKIDAGVNGGFPLGFALRLTGRKYIQFDDDYERKLVVKIEKFLAHKLFFPMIVPNDPQIIKFNALKEWSYLSPKYFKQNEKILDYYQLKSKEYIFIREVSNKSLNYMHQSDGMVLKVASQIASLGLKVVLSLEDKSSRELYPADWIILQEPVNDIHSLIYHSRLLISSGDSMAREGAMLGVPGLYCGLREMLANKVLIQEKMLLHISSEELPNTIKKIVSGDFLFKNQIEFREYLYDKWDDITNFILTEIEQLKKTKDI